MSCPCDRWVHPPQLKIAAGLDNIPRQIATFPGFRLAMLAAIAANKTLGSWRARGDDDLGLMLIEMWAYVCDVLSFYDEVIAHEGYLRTARQRASLRKLVALLGYTPRPAVAASVELAVLADGRQAVTLPAGTAFRSGAFDDESPQTFELDAETKVHPFLNRFTLEAPAQTTMPASTTSLLLETGSASLKTGDVVLLQIKGQPSKTQVGVVESAEVVDGQDGGKYLQVTFEATLSFPASTSPEDVLLSTPTQKASLWTAGGKSAESLKTAGQYAHLLAPIGAPPSGAKTQTESVETLTVILDNRYPQIKAGDMVILACRASYSWYEVKTTTDVTMSVTAGGAVDVLDKSGSKVSVIAPPVSTLATQLILRGQKAQVTSADAAKVVIHYNVVGGAVVTLESKTSISATDVLQADATLEEPTGVTAPKHFLLQDRNESGLAVGGSLDCSTGALTLDQGAKWSTALTCPVDVYANVVSASRGETVSGEVLGSGDASKTNQSFVLKKKPLTYKAAATADDDRAVASTLKVYVNGILWTEVASFFKAKPDSQVYIVRQNDDGESVVTFGDGKRGARLPTGTDNVVAYYRYGAGAATPPAGSITQLAKPVKGLKSVRNPVAASGGGDADPAKQLRKYAPRSALLLGRAVSIQDMEALAAGVSGVRAVSVEWRWNASQQRPVVQVWYIGKSGIESTVSQALHRLSDPTVPIDVTAAQGVAAQLSLSLEIDARLQVDSVLAAVKTKLLHKEKGLLAPERIGIGRPLYRSRIFETVLSVPGADAVEGILWNGAPFTAFALCPGAGKYFDLESGGLLLSGKAT